MKLRVIYERVAARTAQTTAEHPDWPCRRGCDECCRSLGEPPALAPVEEEELERGLALLDAGTRAAIARRIEALAPDARGRYVCPLLDPDAGACLVYHHRPVACRTYGFFVSRGRRAYCERVESFVEQSSAQVVWGNADAVEDDLVRLSPGVTPLRVWFARYRGGG